MTEHFSAGRQIFEKFLESMTRNREYLPYSNKKAFKLFFVKRKKAKSSAKLDKKVEGTSTWKPKNERFYITRSHHRGYHVTVVCIMFHHLIQA